MEQSAPFLRFVIAGNLFRDFLVYSNNKTALDIPGGGVLYTAAGLSLWDEHIGLISYVNEDYPDEWIQDFNKRGFDTRGIQIGRSPLEQRRFMAYPSLDQVNYDNPMAHFARINQAFPKTMLGYQYDEYKVNQFSFSNYFKFNEIPEDYFDATAAHICPMDASFQIRLTSVLKQGQVTTLTLMASDSYMDPIFFDEVPIIVKGVTAFVCTEKQALNLFRTRTKDINQIAETLGSYGCEFVVIEKLNQKYIVYDQLTKRQFEVPAYPVRTMDITGVTDAFCGGFIAGLRFNHQPELAALKGSISASFALEGGNAFFSMDALPELVKARFDAIQHQVTRL
ncbi:MAG: hypothetical protein CL609_12720 [Anaerolineaceae bacterium]|nr:hypothetical protein [Anaerolineaceae bacterium]